MTVRLEEDGPAYTVYRTGSFQVRGAKTEDRMFEAASRFRSVLTDIDVEIVNYEFDHVTSVFIEDFDREVDLKAPTIALGMKNTEHEPEQFPGLIYRPPGFEVTLLVFASGKTIIGELRTATRRVPRLTNYETNSSPSTTSNVPAIVDSHSQNVDGIFLGVGDEADTANASASMQLSWNPDEAE